MYHAMKIYIHQDHPIFSWCDTITKKANNLDNATLFRMRQVMTAVTKKPAALTANEALVMAEVSDTAKKHGLPVPEKGHFFLSYKLLDKLFRDTANPDFFADGLPAQSAQQTHGIFLIVLTFDNGEEIPAADEQPSCQIAAVDTGVDNLAAVTFNTGDKGLLIKGGAIKSINQLYNKRAAAIRSEVTKGGTKKFRPTPESEALDLWRETRMDDYMHKRAAIILARLKEHRIDTLVFGRNRGWKDGATLGKVNNQNFVQLPIAKFGGILKYLCERNGIRFVEQEESYTSKAS